MSKQIEIEWSSSSSTISCTHLCFWATGFCPAKAAELHRYRIVTFPKSIHTHIVVCARLATLLPNTIYATNEFGEGG